MRRVREDNNGLFIVNNYKKWRHGDVVGYSNAYRMDTGDLSVEDSVNVYQAPGPIMRIKTKSGMILHWHLDNAEDLLEDYLVRTYGPL